MKYEVKIRKKNKVHSFSAARKEIEYQIVAVKVDDVNDAPPLALSKIERKPNCIYQVVGVYACENQKDDIEEILEKAEEIQKTMPTPTGYHHLPRSEEDDLPWLVVDTDKRYSTKNGARLAYQNYQRKQSKIEK